MVTTAHSPSHPLTLFRLLLLLSVVIFQHAYASAPPEAVGSLYLAKPKRYLCTATAVSGYDLGLSHSVAILTAAHCIEPGLKKDTRSGTWINTFDFNVSFDGKTFYEVEPYRVGYAESSYDIAVLLFTKNAPTVEPLQMGTWEQVDFGTDIQNFANPLGAGIQYFTGSVTMLYIEPAYVEKNPSWHQNAIASLQVGPGSSGSLILNSDHEYVGVLSSVMEARFGSPFTVFIPQWRFQEFMDNYSAGRTLACESCQLLTLFAAN